MKEKLRDHAFLMWMLVVFFGMSLFYIRIHPMYMQSPDDWTYISYSRQAWPMKGAWNPGKILPETIGGLIGDIGAFVLYPIVRDYVKAISIVYGLAFALLVTIYIYSFGTFVKRCFELDSVQTVFTSFVFLVLHFQLTKVELLNNNYLFKTHGINLGINYFLPLMLCASLAFYLMKKICVDDWFNEHSCDSLSSLTAHFKSLKNGGLFLILYLCIFSNLMMSGTLVALIGASFLARIIRDLKNKKRYGFKKFIFRYSMYLAVFAMDLICAVAELTGGNADLFDGKPVPESIMNYPGTVLEFFGGVNKTVVFISAIVIIGALDLSVAPSADKADGKRFRSALWLSLATVLIDFIYVSLISIRVGGYLAHSRAYNGILIWLVVPLGISCGYIVRRLKHMTAFMPIIAFVMFFVMLNVPDNIGNGFGLGDRMYGSNEASSFYYQEDTSLVEQFVEADKSGAEEFTLYSDGQIGDYGQWAAYRVRRTLLRHGLIDRVMEVTVEKAE